jgi:hypothetical protein
MCARAAGAGVPVIGPAIVLATVGLLGVAAAARATHSCAVVVVTELNGGFSRIYYRNDTWYRDPAYHGKVKVSLCAGDTAVRMDFDADTLPASVPVRFREGRVYFGDVEAAP